VLSAIKDGREQDRRFKDWYKEAGKASRDFSEAVTQIQNPIGPRIHSAIVKGLDIESPMILPFPPEGTAPTFYPQNPESTDLFRILTFLRLGIHTANSSIE
jgi:hypothetical protein